MGAVYLFYFLVAFCAVFLTKGIVTAGDPAATASHILAHKTLFRSGLVVGLFSIALYIAVTALFYELFKPVNRSLPLLAAFFSVVGCAVQASSAVFQLTPLVVLRGLPYLSVFTVEQAQALALTALQLSAQVFNVGLMFFVEPET